jgi:NAD(P)-dependent dehydrogenase (short-subunit alcohol dehydrogenase family)
MMHGLLAAGIRVAGVDRDREPLEALAASAREQDKADDLLTIQTDLTSDAATEEITKATRDRFGASIFSSTTPASAQVESGLTAGITRTNSGRSRLIRITPVRVSAGLKPSGLRHQILTHSQSKRR